MADLQTQLRSTSLVTNPITLYSKRTMNKIHLMDKFHNSSYCGVVTSYYIEGQDGVRRHITPADFQNKTYDKSSVTCLRCLKYADLPIPKSLLKPPKRAKRQQDPTQQNYSERGFLFGSYRLKGWKKWQGYYRFDGQRNRQHVGYYNSSSEAKTAAYEAATKVIDLASTNSGKPTERNQSAQPSPLSK